MSKRANSSTESIISSHDSKPHTTPTKELSASKGSKSELHKRPPTNIHSKSRLRSKMKRNMDFNSVRSSDIENNTEDTSPFDFKQENIIQLPVDDEEEFNFMDDIYKYKQLPNMEDFSEACFGFIVTAICVALLLSISFIVVLSVDLFTPLF